MSTKIKNIAPYRGLSFAPPCINYSANGKPQYIKKNQSYETKHMQYKTHIEKCTVYPLYNYCKYSDSKTVVEQTNLYGLRLQSTLLRLYFVMTSFVSPTESGLAL